MTDLNSLDEVRENIDRIDRAIVKLIAERGGYVKQAAKFKKTAEDVKNPQRVDAVIDKVRSIAVKADISPDLVEQVYRTMIAGFIDIEMAEHIRD